MSLSYLSAILLTALDIHKAPTPTLKLIAFSLLLLILPSFPLALTLSTALHPPPYRLDPLLGPALLHSTLLVWAVVTHALLRTFPTDGIFTPQAALTLLFALLTILNVATGRRAAAAARANPPAANQNPAYEGEAPLRDVAIVGAGVAGLVAAAALAQAGKSVVVLERRRSASSAESGADLALWPGAVSILRALGVRKEFFQRDCFPLDTVHMCNMDFDAAATATVLKTIDMAAVTAGTGERFVLVARQRLMDALRGVVPDGVVVYGADVRAVEEDEDRDWATVHFAMAGGCAPPSDFPRMDMGGSVRARVVIAADGARSVLRKHVSATHGGADAVRFRGEVCYRGVLDVGRGVGNGLSEEVRAKVVGLFPDKPSARTMRINYGAGLRSSFGYMSGSGDVAYWWVKVKTGTMPEGGKMKECSWPEPLKTLHDVTPEESFYMHAVEDSEPLGRWCSPRVVLVGDAAHVVTPNMGQGACMAAEDSFVVATELLRYWGEGDGQLEAFWEYEWVRRPYAKGVLQEARKQLMLGQLSSRFGVALRECLLKMVPMKVLVNKLKQSNFAVGKYIDEFERHVGCRKQEGITF